jgi:hypothetical protein
MTTTRRLKKRSKWLTVIFQVACLNFVFFLGIALFLGGSAANGHSANGHYFLGNHGRMTEVSGATFTYSLIHTYVSMALILVSILLMGFGTGSKRRKRREAK